MCGIIGLWNLQGAPVDREALTIARDSMLHRGPDDAGLFVDGPVALGHRRLSIVDLSAAGHMPMHSWNRQCVGVFNGEIYNFASIRSELQNLGARFVGHGDSEVVVNAYAQWGVECFERFNGMFAIAIWDQARRTMLLARDAMGEKPLYFHWSPGERLLFASSLQACTLLAPDLKQIDTRGVSDYLRFGFTLDDQTLLSGVQKVHPGTVLEFSQPDQCRATAYFDLGAEALAAAESPKKNDTEYIEEFDALLHDAVKIRMVADVPLGAFLSGGIDSSLIVSQMAKGASSDVHTFTVGFDDPTFDESGHAQAIANHLGVRSHVEKLSAERVLGFIAHVVRYYDEPVADFSTLPTSAVSALARKHVTVALSGDGADELFAGYKYYIAQREFERYARVVPRFVRSPLAGLSALVPHKGAARAMARSDAEDAAIYVGRSGFYRGAVNNRIAQELLPDVPLAEEFVANFVRNSNMPSATEGALLYDARFTLPGAWLHKVDRASMASSLELRAPFLDPRVVRFAFSLPLSMRLRRGIKKYVLRRTLAKHVPPSLFERPKQGFTAPVAQWLRGPLREEATRSLSANNLDRFAGLNANTVQNLWKEHLAGADRAQVLWAILTLQWWAEHHLEGRDLAPRFAPATSAPLS